MGTSISKETKEKPIREKCEVIAKDIFLKQKENHIGKIDFNNKTRKSLIKGQKLKT